MLDGTRSLLAVTAASLVAIGCSSDSRAGSGQAGESVPGGAAAAEMQQAEMERRESMATVQAFIRDASGGSAGEAGADRAADGRFVGNFIVSLRSRDGFWVDVGRHTSMDIGLLDPDGGGAIEAMDEVPPGTYDQVRVLLCHSSVDLEPGSRVGSETLADAANVHITETGDVVVLRDIPPLALGPGARSELEIDLNSSGWLTEESVREGRASIPLLESQVLVAVATPGTTDTDR